MRVIDEIILDDNNIAFHPMMGNSYKLNPIAKEILSLYKQHKTKDEIIDELLEKYDVTYNDLHIDVSDFFSKLKIYGIA